MKILGVHPGHDAAAALIIDGKIVADVAEERFTRIKNDTSFPYNAIKYCLRVGGIDSDELDCLALPSKVIPKSCFDFFKIPESCVITSSTSIKRKIKNLIRTKLLSKISKNEFELPIYLRKYNLSKNCVIHLCEHHLAHASSAYYTSGLNEEKVLIITMDGRGDLVSTAIWTGQNNHIKSILKYGGNSSLGWFYSNATEALLWRHGSDEWKIMGLAPYGKPQRGMLKGFHPEFSDGYLSEPHSFGVFDKLYDHGAKHFHGKQAVALSKIADRMGRENFATEVQRTVEEEAFNIILPWLKRENTRHLCCAGGFFLNVKFNQKLWYTDQLDTQWIYPNSGDAGLAVGAALHAYYTSKPREKHHQLDNMYFGSDFSNDDIKTILDDRGLVYRYEDNPSYIAAKYLAKNLVVGWFQGRMESGPRALGNRSILMSPLYAKNKDIINAKVKYREAFRPFCPSILHEKSSEYLVKPRDEFFMTTSFEAKEGKKQKIPAVVHVDGTLRPQMVKKKANQRYYNLIKAFGDLTGEYVILNTSFNVKGEPIVCNPREAIKCFYDTGLDILVLNNFIIEKPYLYQNKL